MVNIILVFYSHYLHAHIIFTVAEKFPSWHVRGPFLHPVGSLDYILERFTLLVLFHNMMS